MANVNAVAAQLATTATEIKPEFILNLGDSFYWCGIQNTTDFQVQVDFVKPYAADSLSSLPWYGVLGNHEVTSPYIHIHTHKQIQ